MTALREAALYENALRQDAFLEKAPGDDSLRGAELLSKCLPGHHRKAGLLGFGALSLPHAQTTFLIVFRAVEQRKRR